jgi:hypothetical protein
MLQLVITLIIIFTVEKCISETDNNITINNNLNSKIFGKQKKIRSKELNLAQRSNNK